MTKKHDEERGCDVIFLGKEKVRKGNGIVQNFLCKTHKVYLSRTGYEWGKYPEHILRINYPYKLLRAILKKK